MICHHVLFRRELKVEITESWSSDQSATLYCLICHVFHHISCFIDPHDGSKFCQILWGHITRDLQQRSREAREAHALLPGQQSWHGPQSRHGHVCHEQESSVPRTGLWAWVKLCENRVLLMVGVWQICKKWMIQVTQDYTLLPCLPRFLAWRLVMWCDVMWCDVMWCDVMWCDVMWCDVMWCDVMWCDVMWCDVMWCDVVRCVSCVCVKSQLISSYSVHDASFNFCCRVAWYLRVRQVVLMQIWSQERLWQVQFMTGCFDCRLWLLKITASLSQQLIPWTGTSTSRRYVHWE